MGDDLGCVPVDLEPRERFAKDSAMGQRPLHPRIRFTIANPPLKAEDLFQSLDVAPGQRQVAQPWSHFSLIVGGRRCR